MFQTHTNIFSILIFYSFLLLINIFFFQDSIEYLSTSWNSIYSTGNDTEPKLLDLFRQFHCADCLKSFQEQQQNRVKMNTPPPPLQPISEDATNGLFNYFGPSTNQIPTNIRLTPFSINSSTNTNQESYHLDLQETKICN